MTYRIVVSDSKVIDLESGQTAFADLDSTVLTTDAQSPEPLIADAAGADALIVDASTQVTTKVLSALDSLRVVGRSGIGVDNVDIEKARELAIPVVNVPDYCVDEVSTHALGMLLSCARKLPLLDAAVKNGIWDWSTARAVGRIAGGTVGVVGFGTIGRSFARKLRGFDVDVLVFDPYVSATDLAGFAVTRVGFDRLLSDSDFVSIHAPLTDETRGMFDADALKRMPNHAILINTARGPIVDEDALGDVLEANELGGVGLDVRDPEPPTNTTFSGFENVVLSPHAGFYSEAARRDLTQTVTEDVTRVLRGEHPHNPVEPGARWRQ
jgi:D-3-phosphoglycerate dehydrogenase